MFTPLTVTPVPDTATVSPAARFVPVRVMFVVAPALPEAGLMELNVAAGTTVNATAELVLEPLLTVTLRAPDAAELATAKFAVICVGLTTVTPLTVTPEPDTATVAPFEKFVPVR